MDVTRLDERINAEASFFSCDLPSCPNRAAVKVQAEGRDDEYLCLHHMDALAILQARHAELSVEVAHLDAQAQAAQDQAAQRIFADAGALLAVRLREVQHIMDLMAGRA